jgi:hypothetical protein
MTQIDAVNTGEASADVTKTDTAKTDAVSACIIKT